MGDMTVEHAMLLYHGQVDLICLIILFVLVIGFIRVREKTKDQRLFFYYLISCIAFAIADFFSYLFLDNPAKGIGAILYISNALYFITSTFTCLLWLFYMMEKTSEGGLNRKSQVIAIIPFILFIVYTLTTFLHKTLFYITDDHSYVRGSLIFIHWIVAGGYIAFPTIRILIHIIRAKTKSERLELYPFLIVVVFPLITTIVQILWQGTSLIQVGMMLAAVYVYLRRQNSYAYKDGLTGLNNRRRFNLYLEEKVETIDPSDTIFMIMMDVDFFKEINDTYGHPAGDSVLIAVGDILKNVCLKHDHIFPARYGGDEFTIFGYGYTEEELKDFIEEIKVETKDKIITDKNISINVSIGYVFGHKKDYDNLDILLNEADKEMYKIKSGKLR